METDKIKPKLRLFSNQIDKAKASLQAPILKSKPLEMTNTIPNSMPKVSLFANQAIKAKQSIALQKLEGLKPKIILKSNIITPVATGEISETRSGVSETRSSVLDPNLIKPKVKALVSNKPMTSSNTVSGDQVRSEAVSFGQSSIVQDNSLNDLKLLNLWSEKYRPKNLDQIIGNTEQIQKIREWFRQFLDRDPDIKKALLFSGCPGTSKTTVAHAILTEFGYSVKEYNASDVRSKKLVEANLDKLINMEQVDRQFQDDFKPFGIIMDEVDGMSSGDKGGMTQLIKIINPNRGKRSVKKEDKQKAVNRWIPPIICICNNNYDKKIVELKKDCLEIKFDKPTLYDLSQVVERVSKNENLNFSESGSKVLCELAQGDFRRLMFLLQNFSKIDVPIIEANNIYEYYDVISKKSLDLNNYEITNKIFNRLLPVEEALKLYETDKSLLPMMIHENYIEVINSQNTIIPHKISNCQLSIDAIITGDITEKIMYNTQSWYLQPIHGLSSFYVPSYYANSFPKLAHERSKWTTTLGRFSLQRSNVKTINLVGSMLNNGRSYNVQDIHLLSEIILFNLLDPKGNEQKGIQYLKNYNLSILDLEKLIKMNKLNDKYKKLYKSKQKTHLKKLFGNVIQKENHVMPYNLKSSSGGRGFSLGGAMIPTKVKKKSSSSDNESGSEDEVEEEEELEEFADDIDVEDPDLVSEGEPEDIAPIVPKKRGRKPKNAITVPKSDVPKRKYVRKAPLNRVQTISVANLIRPKINLLPK